MFKLKNSYIKYSVCVRASFVLMLLVCRYTKYLYPLECKLNSFSNPNDLQSAIEGNKREGRTSSFGPYGGMPSNKVDTMIDMQCN